MLWACRINFCYIAGFEIHFLYENPIICYVHGLWKGLIKCYLSLQRVNLTCLQNSAYT